ncbi:MAG: C39 family peptidase [Planctomycetota bacterium]
MRFRSSGSAHRPLLRMPDPRPIAWGIIAVFGMMVPARAASDAPRLKDARIADVPHVRQKPGFSGEACAEMILRKLGKTTDQNAVFNRTGVDPLQGRGAHAAELARALTTIGFAAGDIEKRFDAGGIARGVESEWRALLADLRAGVPSIIGMRQADTPRAPEHFRLVLGYQADTDEVIYHEPAETDGAYRRMGRSAFCALWPLPAADGGRTVTRLRLEPRKIADIPSPTEFTDADYAQTVRRIRTLLDEKIPEREGEFTLVLAPPFVVAGDEPAATVRVRARNTVQFAVSRLKRDFFRKDPDEALSIWLFRSDTSYRKCARALFGDDPDTPYGYYSAAHAALVMNIATGGGTLVHEIVHPFMRANFPDCPAWLNEGMGSLYEQSGDQDGHIVGRPNWRLPGLQKAVRARALPAFRALCAMDDDTFYNRKTAGAYSDHYAQARYLCYYLQEKGLFVAYVRDFIANRKTDPTGYDTLVRALGAPDMAAFQKTWEAFVMELRFPEP